VGVPAIFFTARINPADLERYRAAGAIGTLPKPFDPLKLGRQIAQIWADNFPSPEGAP
jgi:CheY-like chemotaxis protein